jgi:hypothetical protein
MKPLINAALVIAFSAPLPAFAAPYDLVIDRTDVQIEGQTRRVFSINGQIRLRYEIAKEVAPYVDVSFEQFTGNTANFVAAEGGPTSNLRAAECNRSRQCHAEAERQHQREENHADLEVAVGLPLILHALFRHPLVRR